MTNLAQITESIKSEIKVNAQGQGFISIRGAARLCDVDPKSLRYAIESVEIREEQKRSKLAERLIQQGFDVGNWNEGIPELGLAIIVKYYAYHAGRYITELAEQVDLVFSAMGIRVWLQNVSGYQSQVATNENFPAYQLLKQITQLEQDKQALESRVTSLEQLTKAIVAKSTAIAKEAKQPKLTEEKHQIFIALIKACKGQAITHTVLLNHSLGKRVDVRKVYGTLKKIRVCKSEVIKLLRDAASYGYGSYDIISSLFVPIALEQAYNLL